MERRRKIWVTRVARLTLPVSEQAVGDVRFIMIGQMPIGYLRGSCGDAKTPGVVDAHCIYLSNGTVVGGFEPAKLCSLFGGTGISGANAFAPELVDRWVVSRNGTSRSVPASEQNPFHLIDYSFEGEVPEKNDLELGYHNVAALEGGDVLAWDYAFVPMRAPWQKWALYLSSDITRRTMRENPGPWAEEVITVLTNGPVVVPERRPMNSAEWDLFPNLRHLMSIRPNRWPRLLKALEGRIIDGMLTLDVAETLMRERA